MIRWNNIIHIMIMGQKRLQKWIDNNPHNIFLYAILFIHKYCATSIEELLEDSPIIINIYLLRFVSALQFPLLCLNYIALVYDDR